MSQHARNNPEQYERSPEARAFSANQERIIRETMKVCEDAGCDGPDHNDHE